MAGVSERETQTPCGYCGRLVEQPGGNRRRRRYCDRSCRQRAYELRTALARRHADEQAGRVLAEPVERVIERVIQPRHPSTGPAWIEVLTALAGQLRDGPLRWQQWHHPAIRTALEEALAVLTPAPVPLGPDAGRVLAVLRAAGATSTTTTLDRLAGATGLPVDVVRVALAELVATGRAQVARVGQPRADLGRLAGHARFTVTWTP